MLSAFNFFFFKTELNRGIAEEWRERKRREVRRRVVKIAVGCHPGPSLCGNEGLEAALLLPDAVRLLRSSLMHGPSHQDCSIRLPSTYTLPHTHTHIHTHTHSKTCSLLKQHGCCKRLSSWFCPPNYSRFVSMC